jgi:2-polyprenyl-3-methyl-5-hydroxy-6-metoxy-1,4-benzoquinol methylase
MVKIKEIIKKAVFKVLEYSLNSASKEQGLKALKIELAEIIPDLSQQYTSFKIEGSYIVNKLRSQHAFQVELAQEAISLLDRDKRSAPNLVDIGDSSGAHLHYLNTLSGGGNIRAISVNLDPAAVKKIRDKGFEAIESRAELLHEHPDFNGSADIFLSYEMVEHLLDPTSFLHAMSTKSKCDYFVVTVPYLHRSRIGLHQVRHLDKQQDRAFNAETTHIFELSPDDWDLIFRFSGWKIVKSVRYTQYPKNILNPLSVLRYLWRKLDFDGFYGVILEKDDSISKRYQDW